MELNREQIIKALELCTTEEDCVGCPYLIRRGDGSILPCTIDADALSLINELNEENERLRERADRHLENLKAVLNERNESTIKADTVRKMQERLKEKAYTNNYCQEVVLVDYIDQIAKEMLGEEIQNEANQQSNASDC